MRKIEIRDRMKVPPARGEVWRARAFMLAAFLYVACGVIAAAWLSPRVPFADSWRHYQRLLDMSFPASVLWPDNGHAEILANLVRLASLRWLRGDENVQIAIGIALALGAFSVFAATLRRIADVPSITRAAAGLALALGVFWLGNARALLHDNDSLHVYSTLLCLGLAIRCLLAGDATIAVMPRRAAWAALFCFCAMFSFGSGIAAFAAVFALLLMRRASWRSHGIVALALLFGLGCYWFLPRGGAGLPLALNLLEQIGVALRWLAAPLMYLLWPFVDPVAAAALPQPLHAIAGGVAQAWTHAFGDVRRSTTPQWIGGIAYVAWLVSMSWRAWRRPAVTSDLMRFGLALAWFGAAVGGLIALTRTTYFGVHPQEIYAPRYLPWSSLGWAGLLLAALGGARAGRARVIVAVVAALALSAEVGMPMVLNHEREIADDVALASVVGVWPDEGGYGETDPEVTEAGAIAMRKAHVGPFAWPEAALVGRSPPVDTRRLQPHSLTATLPSNRLSNDGVRLEAVLADAPPCERLLVIHRGIVVGLLRHVGGDRWRGAAGGVGDSDDLIVLAPRCNAE